MRDLTDEDTTQSGESFRRVSGGSLIPESQAHVLVSLRATWRGRSAQGGLPRPSAQGPRHEGESHGGPLKCVSCSCTSRRGDRGRPGAPAGRRPRASAARDPVPPVKGRVGAVGQRLHRRGCQLPPASLLVLFAEAHPERRDLERNSALLAFLPGRWGVVHSLRASCPVSPPPGGWQAGAAAWRPPGQWEPPADIGVCPCGALPASVAHRMAPRQLSCPASQSRGRQARSARYREADTRGFRPRKK